MASAIFATRGEMSGSDLARVLSVNRKTGMRMNRVLRRLVCPLEPSSLPGSSEWDASVFSRQWVLGGVPRDTRQCVLQCIADRREESIMPFLLLHSDAEGVIFTDELPVYYQLPNRLAVCHSREFVCRDARCIHTNSIKGVWGHMKEFSRHIYRGFPRQTLPQFLAEFMFRYNHRSYETRKSVLSALLSRKSIPAHLV